MTRAIPYPDSGITLVTYNSSTKLIKIKVSSRAIQTAKVELAKFEGIFTTTKLDTIFGKQQNCPLASLFRPVVKVSDICSSQEEEFKVFAIRAREDKAVVSLWEENILPALSDILSDNRCEDYTAALLRRGLSQEQAEPFIQIQSPWPPSREVKKTVRSLVYETYCHLTQYEISVRFSKGELELLVDNNSDDDSDDGQDETVDFPYYKRWQTRPGMGASIGPLTGPENKKVSATLGGYILVDGNPYMLTIKHFIPEEPKTIVTSPSLTDVKYVRGLLLRSRQDIAVEIDINLNSGDQDMTINNFEDSLSLEDQKNRGFLVSLDMLLKEVHSDRDYTLGNVFRRSEPHTGPPSGSGSLRSASVFTTDELIMDWALCNVTHDRLGENRHRYRHDQDPGHSESSSQEDTGAGDLCTETGDLKCDTKVHYVGRKSGKRFGTINGTRTLVTQERKSTYEWSIFNDGEKLKKEDVEGDSGAWVLDSQNRLVAQLYGFCGGLLLCTPIKKIFTDIKVTLGATTISLPPERPNDQPFHRICEVQPDKPKKVNNRLNLDTLPKPSYLPADTDPLAKPAPVRTKVQQRLGTSRNIELSSTIRTPTSPVPSLVHSMSSSPEIEALPLMEACAETTLSSPAPVKGKSNQAIHANWKHTDSIQVDKHSELVAPSENAHRKSDMDENLSQVIKHSIPFILCAAASQHSLASTIHCPSRSPLRLERKASTFPLLRDRLPTESSYFDSCGVLFNQPLLPTVTT